MKTSFLLLVILALIPSSSSCPAASKLYVDDEGRYSFEFSGDWREVEDAVAGADGYFVLARSGKAVAEVIITHETAQEKITLEEYVKKEKALIEKKEGYTKINEEEGFKIGGYPAAWILVNATEKDVSGKTTTTKISQYFIIKGDEFWGITAITSEDEQDLISMIQRTIVKSFEFSTGGKVSLRPLVQEDIIVLFDPAQRFSIRVPESWQVTPTDGHELAVESDIGTLYIFSMALKGEDKKLTAKEIANNFIVDNEVLEESHVIEEAPVRIGTENGYMMNYEGKKSGYTFHVQLIALSRDDNAFYNYFISSPKKWEENRGMIAAIQHTFSFTKRQTASIPESRLPAFLEQEKPKSVDDVRERALSKTSEEISDISAKLLWEPFSKDNVPK